MPADRLYHKKAGHSKKVSGLSHLEFRVWTQYLLSADDFGVMRASAIALQADNDALAACSLADVQAAVEHLIAIGLVRTFEHQGARYLFQHDWQEFQKVEWPGKTIHPAPSGEALDACTEATRLLFDAHPGGKKVHRSKRGGGEPGPEDGVGSSVLSGTREVVPASTRKVLAGTASSRSACTRATRARERASTAKANGSRLTARADGSGKELEETLPPLDEWLRELQAQYPPQAVTSGYQTETAFLDEILNDGRPPADVFADMLVHLDNQLAGYQWRVKRMIPRLDRWLADGKWKQLHDANPPTTYISERTLQNEASGDAFVHGGNRGNTH